MAKEKANGRPFEIEELVTVDLARGDGEDFVYRLDGISCAKSLKELFLSFHRIESIAQLASLEQLRVLGLRTNPVSVKNLEEIAELLPFLVNLEISMHPGDEDPRWLGEMRQLERIRIDGQGATNWVVQELAKLAGIGHLMALRLVDTKIDTLEPLAPYGDQFDVLELIGIEPRALAWLNTFTRVRTFQVAFSTVEDLNWVPTLNEVYFFYVLGSRVSDLSGLSKVVNAKDVNLSDNRIVDISPIRALTKMKVLKISGNPSLSDLSALTALYNMEVLDASSCAVENVQPLTDLVSSSQSRLKEINLLNNPELCKHASLSDLRDVCNAKSVLLRIDC